MNFKDMRIKDILAVVKYERHYYKQLNIDKRSMHFLGIVLKGKSENTVNGKKHYLSEDSIYFYNSKDSYSCKSIESPSITFSVHFTTEEDLDTESFCLKAANSAKIINLFQKAEKALISQKTLELYSLIYAICSEVNILKEKKYFPKDKRMIDAKEYIDENFNDPDCLENVVKRSDVCHRRFCEIFRRVYDITPNKYIMEKKIEYAKILLSTGDFLVSEVSAICNFSDVYYFSRVFKSITGTTPGKWNK